jgi:hypothetical protein
MQRSIYDQQTVLLTSKHKKSIAISPAFRELLGAEIAELELDTDTLGTFSGEVQRSGTAIDCVKRKCLWGLEQNKSAYGIANEGSFGPHPFIPSVSADLEILYFRDLKNDFELEVKHLSPKTNFAARAICDFEELELFAASAGFPSHALIVSPNETLTKSVIFKGVNCSADLFEAFTQSRKLSVDGNAWVETDMRAHMNPTRMEVIREAAERMARQLSTHCPICQMPGWGVTSAERGLACEVCGLPTEMIQRQILVCTKCPHKEYRPRDDGLTLADPSKCSYCNP